MSIVKRLDINITGRDFIVGDMHGFLDLFQAELARQNFDPSCDRVFSVGDLIDRGPDSMGCLRLLKQPWFHAVRGNHEQMLLGHLFPESLSPEASLLNSRTFLEHGGAWVTTLSESDEDELRTELVPHVHTLPYLMTVGEGRARFNIVHAEFMTGDPEFSIQQLTSPALRDTAASTGRVLTDSELDALPADAQSPFLDAMLWGRRLLKSSDQKTAGFFEMPVGRLGVSATPWHDGLSLTYVGHSPVRQMMLHQSHVFIDRGAYLRRSDSCLLMLCHQNVMAALRLHSLADGAGDISVHGGLAG